MLDSKRQRKRYKAHDHTCHLRKNALDQILRGAPASRRQPTHRREARLEDFASSRNSSLAKHLHLLPSCMHAPRHQKVNTNKPNPLHVQKNFLYPLDLNDCRFCCFSLAIQISLPSSTQQSLVICIKSLYCFQTCNRSRLSETHLTSKSETPSNQSSK